MTSPKHDLNTMLQYLNFIPIHKSMLTLRKIKIIFAFAYKRPTPYRKHACKTNDQLLCHIRNIIASYKTSDIGLYLLLSKFILRIQTVEPRSSHMDHDENFTMLIQTMYDV